MTKTIVIVGTLDTKGEEIRYLKELIEGRGHKTIVLDVSSLRQPPFRPDISHEEVAKAAGTTIKEVAALDEGEAVKVMTEGASRIAQELYSAGRLDGIIAVGGTMGTSLGQAVMRALPLGVPKLMVSTMAFTSFITPEMVSAGQMLTDCVAGLWGLNVISRAMLKNAAGAIVGMAEAYEKIAPQKPVIGITTLGSSVFNYAFQIRPSLEQRGYEVAVFHSGGTVTFEQLIEQGLIAAALDLQLSDLVAKCFYSERYGAGPERLEAASRMGIPQVVAPGGIEFIFGIASLEILPPRFIGRPMHWHNPTDLLVMTSTEERAMLGELVAQKLNRATGPTAVVIPIRGFSEWGKPGRPFYSPEGDRAFVEALKEHIEPKVKVVELDAHINDRAFADAVVAILDEMMKGG